MWIEASFALILHPRIPLRQCSRSPALLFRPLTFLKSRLFFASPHDNVRAAGTAPLAAEWVRHDDDCARTNPAREPASDHEQKQIALTYLHEAWGEARLDGVDGDCLAQAALFTALSELVTTYGEDATAKYAEGLPARIRNGEFSIPLSRQ